MKRCESVVAIVLVAVVSGACGGGDAEVEMGADAGTGTPAGATAQGASGGTLDCSAFPEELIRQVAMGYTGIRQLDPTRTLETLEELGGLPDPSTFRAFADVFERLDRSDIEALQFDTPDTTAVGQRQLADLLEAALSARDDAENPAWAELQTFVDEHLARQQTSTNYYMSEADCV